MLCARKGAVLTNSVGSVSMETNTNNNSQKGKTHILTLSIWISNVNIRWQGSLWVLLKYYQLLLCLLCNNNPVSLSDILVNHLSLKQQTWRQFSNFRDIDDICIDNTFHHMFCIDTPHIMLVAMEMVIYPRGLGGYWIWFG